MTTLDLMGKYEDEEAKLRQSAKLVRLNIEMLLSYHRIALSKPRDTMGITVKAGCMLVVSESVHDPRFEYALSEEIRRLSSGNSTERALAAALADSIALAATVDPDTIPRIYDTGNIISDRIGICCSNLTGPLLTFVFGASKKTAVPSSSPDQFERTKALDVGDQKPRSSIDPSPYYKYASFLGLGNFWSGGKQLGTDIKSKVPISSFSAQVPSSDEFERTKALDQKLTGTKLGNKNVDTDIESQMPAGDAEIDPSMPVNPPNRAFSSMLSVEANLAVAAVGGAAIAGLLASGAKDSPSVRVFSAAAAVGFNCSLLAAFTCKHQRVSGFLSKIGAIGTASAVMVALENTVDTAMFGNGNVNALVIALICFIDVVVIFR